MWRVEDREDVPVLIAPDGREYSLDFAVSGDIVEAVTLASERAAALVAAINQRDEVLQKGLQGSR